MKSIAEYSPRVSPSFSFEEKRANRESVFLKCSLVFYLAAALTHLSYTSIDVFGLVLSKTKEGRAMEYLLGWVVFAALVGWWANAWGRDSVLWGLLALFLSPIIAGIALLVVGRNEDSQLDKRGLVRCPYCAELVKEAAVKCKHCGSDITSTKGAEYLEEQQLLDLIDKLKSGRR